MAGRGASAPTTVTVLTLPGTSGNYGSTPDSAANSITSDIDIRVHLSMAAWIPAEFKGLISKWGAAGSRAYRVFVDTSGFLGLSMSGDGSANASVVSSAATGFTNGTAHWVRVTWRNSDNRVQFFTSEDGSSWTQLGTDQTLAFTGIHDNASPLAIGAFSSVSTTTNLVAGTVYYADVRNGIDGAAAATFDPSAVTKLGTRNPTSFVSATGETWTMTGSAWDWVTV